MSDSEPDLYSFLQSKDLASDEEETDTNEATDQNGAADTQDEADVELRSVDSFDHADSPASTEDVVLNFEDDDLGDRLGNLPSDTLDEAPFGIVQVDDDGIVQFYNQYESNLAGVAPEDALGRNFFTELAPCSGNRLFHGRFKNGVRQNDLDERFTYAFTYKMSPTLVDVRMHRDDAGRNWILVRKR